MTNDKPILVLGATGKTGRRILDRLTTKGIPTRAGSRSATPPFSWEDRSTWGPVVDGIGAAYIAYYPDLAAPGASATVIDFAEQAIAAGAERLVLITGRGEDEAKATEKLFADLDVDWTIVRASWFSQNFSEAFFHEGVRGGSVALPANDTPEPFVDADDIADVAVAALTEEGHAGQLYEVTGPRMLTFREAVAEIAKATDREISFVQVPPDEYAAAMAAEGAPDEVTEVVVDLFTTILDGRNAYVTDGVERALGRPARDFYDYAWDTARTGVWDAS